MEISLWGNLIVGAWPPGVQVVRFARPDLDEWLKHAPDIESCALFQELREMALDGLGQGQTLVLNLALVEFASVEFLKLLLLIQRVVGAYQARLILCRAGTALVERLRNFGLLGRFEMAATEREAVALAP
jgi:anti-anti-sigma regulatory factor